MRTFIGVGTTGLIFGAIVAAWLAYLVPLYLRKSSPNPAEATDPTTRFSAAVRIVQHGTPASRGDTESIAARVSTPITRSAAVGEIRLAERRAAGRRRNVILVLLGALGLLTLLAALGRTPWWSLAIPGGLLVVFLAIARFSVRAMHRSFDRRLEALQHGNDEATVIIRGEEHAPAEKKREAAVTAVELGAPVGRPGTLWDPLPITRPTYVSAPPVSGRTVRTIDLSGPQPAPKDNLPVVADAPEPKLVTELPHAVGE